MTLLHVLCIILMMCSGISNLIPCRKKRERILFFNGPHQL